jgi:hypothetical protein
MEHNKSNKRVFTYIRQKPLLVNNDENICYVNSIHNLSIKIKRIKVNLEEEIQLRQFYADYIFDDESSNDKIFNTIVNNRLNGENRNLIYFAYGQSGTGKTHTLLGNEGLIYKTCIKLLSEGEIHFSSFQIYEDNIFDLYENKRGKIFERNNTIFVTGVVENKIQYGNQILSILEINKKNREKGISSHNNESSRSHAIYRIKYKKYGKKYNVQFIDLAGTERACNANIQFINKNSFINMSLLSLKECIRAYINNSKYIPFRSNKLTLYLRDFFINNCCIMMISMISSHTKHIIDTLDTLKYSTYMQTISEYKKFKIEKNLRPQSNPIPNTIVINSNKDVIKMNKTQYVKNIPILESISETNITRKTEIKVMNKKNKRIRKKIKNNRLLNDYLSKRDKIIQEENNLFMDKKYLEKDDTDFYSSIVKILNKKINCIEDFCSGIKEKYKT